MRGCANMTRRRSYFQLGGTIVSMICLDALASPLPTLLAMRVLSGVGPELAPVAHMCIPAHQTLKADRGAQLPRQMDTLHQQESKWFWINLVPTLHIESQEDRTPPLKLLQSIHRCMCGSV